MSAHAESVPAEATADPAPGSRWWSAVDRAMVWAGDRLNPILVKETRQALKSRQFTITFLLLLACGWIWSIFGVAIIGPDIKYGTHGADMFIGYYLILAVPLFVIVPFGAFRSLAGEQEDRTYELMSITGLGPRQIIRGKLASAVLQMLIYLSAISPCLAFSYMLRGIDFPTIFFILSYTTLSSLGLAVIGLLVGTVTSEKHWQVVLSVLLIAGLLFAGFMAFLATINLLWWEYLPFGDSEFWLFCAAMLTGYASYFVLVFYAAVAQITFASDNRSTRLRVTMLLQHVLFTGWMAWLWIAEAGGEEEVLLVYMILVGLHWYVMGAFMTGEASELSPRVKRQLPQSVLGRVFFTWFNPGPGTGYLLAVSSLLGVLAVILIAVGVVTTADFSGIQNWSAGDAGQVLGFGVLGLSYVAMYLGAGMLLVRLLRKVTYVGILLSVLLNLLLLMLGIFVPWVIQWLTPSLRYLGYSLLHVLNPVYTLYHVGDGSGLPAEGPILLTLVPLVAAIVFVLNLPAVAREVRRVRIAKPQRVAEEDAALAALKKPPQPLRTGPWD